MSKPARLYKVEEPHNISPLMKGDWLYIHPVAIILAGIIAIVLIGALLFAISGGCAVESGVGRNLAATL